MKNPAGDVKRKSEPLSRVPLHTALRRRFCVSLFQGMVEESDDSSFISCEWYRAKVQPTGNI